MIEAGARAPAFTLRDQDANEVSLSDYAGRRLVIAFYPADFSGVCSDQLAVYQQLLGEFESRNAAILGVSVDGVFCHKAFSEQLGLGFPLLSDFHPKGAMASAYGAYIEERGHTNRSLVVVDSGGTVSWSYESDPLKVPGANLIFDALAGA